MRINVYSQELTNEVLLVEKPSNTESFDHESSTGAKSSM